LAQADLKNIEPSDFYRGFTKTSLKPQYNPKGFWTPYISPTTQPIELKFFVGSYSNDPYPEKIFQLEPLSRWYFMDFTNTGKNHYFDQI